MELLLIRHALPVRVDGGEGPADPSLSSVGVRQAAVVAGALADEPLAAVVSSPLRRARETAAFIAAAHGLDVVVHEGLAEFDRNTTWYVPIEELKAARDPRWPAMVEGRLDEDHGIDLETFRAGALGAIEAIIANYAGGAVAAVTHGGVINAYVAEVLGAASTSIFYPHYASVSRILASRGGVRSIHSLNEGQRLSRTCIELTSSLVSVSVRGMPWVG